MSDFREMLDMVDVEDFLTVHGIEFRSGMGSSGPQLNLRRCPVCEGEKWKVYLNAETGLGNCFSGSCEAKFNKWSYIKALCGRTAYQELKDYCKDLGWRPKPKSLQPAVTSDVVLPNYVEIQPGTPEHEYLYRRGFDDHDIDHFQWKYCRYGSIPGPEGEQFFTGRIIIPVFDLYGSLVTFQGRDITGQAKNKYKFPKGLKGTGKYLYNGWEAADCEEVIIGEGVFDVAAIRRAIQSLAPEVGTVGSFGKSLSKNRNQDDQYHSLIEMQKRNLRRVIFMWDGERSALISAYETALVLRHYDFRVAVAELPKDKDPNEVSPQEVVAAYTAAKDLSSLDITRRLFHLKRI